MSQSVLIDLKTTVDASMTGFSRSIEKFGYHISAAMYLDGCNQCAPLLEECCTSRFKSFAFIVVENTAPYLSAVYELSPDSLMLGKALYQTCMLRRHRAIETERYGYPHDEIRPIDVPGYAKNIHIV